MKAVRLLLCALGVSVLAGCENSAVSYMVEGKEHAVILVREQSTFWGDVNQAVIVSRLPVCQRRYPIQSAVAGQLEMDLFEAGYRLWALRQGQQWYLAGSDKCLLQEWANPGGQAPGRQVGRFIWKDGGPVFEAAK